MSTVLLILLLAALIYTVVQMKAGAEWGKPAVVGLTVLIVLVALGRWACRGRPRTEADLQATYSYAQACNYELANALGKHMPKGGKALVFAMAMGPEGHQAMLDGLNKGFEPYGITIGGVEMPLGSTGGGAAMPGMPDRTPPPDPAKLQKEYQAVLAKYPDAAGLLIFGGPQYNMESFVPEGDKKLPLGIMGDKLTPAEAVARVKAGTATVVCVLRPDIDWPTVAKISSAQRKFRRTYFLVTPDTVADIEDELK